MIEQQNPITPPPELVMQWIAEIWHEGTPVQVAASDLHLAAKSSQWGYEQRGAANEAELQKARDEELEACCAYISRWFATPEYRAAELRAARRPKAPSLKVQALQAAQRFYANGHDGCNEDEVKYDFDIIRRALNSLPD